jgi:hypothetical protein
VNAVRHFAVDPGACQGCLDPGDKNQLAAVWIHGHPASLRGDLRELPEARSTTSPFGRRKRSTHPCAGD